MPAAFSAASISLPPPWTTTSGVPVAGDRRERRDHRREVRAILEQLAAELEDQRAAPVTATPSVSSRPSITFMFCTAWPDAPFSRLSITDTRIARPDGSTRQPMSQKLVCATCLISGSAEPTRRTNVAPP